MQRLICCFRSVCKLISQWICNQSTNLSTRPAKQSNSSSVEVSVLLHVLDLFFSFFKDNVNEWVTFACDGTGPAEESKRTKRVQGWSRLNLVGWYTHYCFLAYSF